MFDWKSIKEKAQKIAADVPAIGDKISASAKENPKDVERALRILGEVAQDYSQICRRAGD